VQSEISRLLKQRGHYVVQEGNDKDILLPANEERPEVTESFKTILYSLMQRDEFRKSFRNWAFGQDFDENVNGQSVRNYVELCERFGGWGSNEPGPRQKRYASTFEWYISELLRQQFAVRASGFGLRLKDAHPDDEFDCVALLDEGSVFVECKTGQSELYKDVSKFNRRDAEISASCSLYLFDRDYTFQKTGEDSPKISRERAMRLRILGVFEVSVGKHKFFEVCSVPNDGETRFFLACSAFDGLEERIRYMIRYSGRGLNLRPADRPLYRRREIFCYGPDPMSIRRSGQ
jgi:hypothetical protein